MCRASITKRRTRDETNQRKKSNSKHHFKKLSVDFVSQKMLPKDATIKISFNVSPNTIKNVDWTPMSVLERMRNNNGSSVLLDPIEKKSENFLLL